MLKRICTCFQEDGSVEEDGISSVVDPRADTIKPEIHSSQRILSSSPERTQIQASCEKSLLLKSQDMTVFVEQFENSNSEEQSQTSLEYEPMEGSRDRSLPVEMCFECYSNGKSFLESRK